jgi:hypothetical protein
MRRLVVCGAVVAALLPSGCGGSGGSAGAHHPARETPAVAAPSTTAFGATVNTLFNAPLYTPVQVSAELAALDATGATLARSDVLWEKTELAPPSGGVHHYDWTFDDGIASALAAHALTWFPILDYAANWAKADPTQLHSPPRTPGEFASFAAAFAARYGPGGVFWRTHTSFAPRPPTTYEVWNEPDGGFWYPAPDAAAYADLYLAARAAIDAVAPGSRVIIGGLVHAATFLPQLLSARPRLATQLDGVGIHLYDSGPEAAFASVRSVRSLLDAHALDRTPLYITEVGWSTRPAHNRNWAPESARPAYVLQTVQTLGRSNCGIAALLVYSWVTPERSEDNLEDWYGIHPPPPAQRSSADTRAFSVGVQTAQAPGPEANVCPPPPP